MPIDPDLIDWRQRRYVSQFDAPTIGLITHAAGVPTDADGAVTAALIRQLSDGTTEAVATYTATKADVGTYEITLPSADTAVSGDYALEWTWTQSAQAQSYVVYLVIGQANPDYDFLTTDIKGVVDEVYLRFADCFDSAAGGPNLQMYYQSHYSRGRIAQLVRIGLGRINIVAQPHTTYTIDGQGGAIFPTAQWGALLSMAGYVECLKHLCRSYVEQPMVQGGNITRLDRRDYLQRWQSILQMEEDTLSKELSTFKISMFSLGKPKVLVSGGVYGRYGPTRIAGSVAARPRYYYRFYS
jgi:hypothetical protein